MLARMPVISCTLNMRQSSSRSARDRYPLSPKKSLRASLGTGLTLPGVSTKSISSPRSLTIRCSLNPKNNPRYANFPEAAEAYARLYEMVAFGAVEAPVAGYDPVRKLMSNVVSKVAIKGEGDIKAALDEAVAQANEVLKENAPKGY